jgi:hypothetical protein
MKIGDHIEPSQSLVDFLKSEPPPTNADRKVSLFRMKDDDDIVEKPNPFKAASPWSLATKESPEETDKQKGKMGSPWSFASAKESQQGDGAEPVEHSLYMKSLLQYIWVISLLFVSFVDRLINLWIG